MRCTASTPIQTSGKCRNSRRSTIPAQLPSQSIRELETPEFGTACAPPFGTSYGIREARVSVANADLLIPKCSSVRISSLELSIMVANVMTKNHTIESHTQGVSAIWLT
jgi:hypothetical protein